MRIVHARLAAVVTALAVGATGFGTVAMAGASRYTLTLQVHGDYGSPQLTECGKTGHFHFFHANPGAGNGHHIQISGTLTPSVASFRPVLHFLKCERGKFVGVSFVTLSGQNGTYAATIEATPYTTPPATTYYRIYTTYGGAVSPVKHLAIAP